MTEAPTLRELQLVLFFTRGVSLDTWRRLGTLERELRPYRALLPALRGITLVTYGGREDLVCAAQLGPGFRVVCNRFGLPAWAYRALVSRLLPRLWTQPTAVKSNQVPGAEVALRAARVARAPFVARCGYLPAAAAEALHGVDAPQACAARASEERVLRAADRVIVTTPALAAFAVERYGLAPARVAVVPNAVDVERFCPSERVAAHPRRVAYVGRLDDEQKNLTALVAALEGLGVELWLIGAGPLEAVLRADAARRGVPTRFLGRLENAEIPEALRRCSAFVLPSRWEGHPKALLEAMACGMPVIGSAVPGIRELLRHRESGFLCEPTRGSIRAAVAEVLGDARLRARLGRGARAAVLESATPRHALERELALWREIAAGAWPGPGRAGRVRARIAGRLRRGAGRVLRTGLRALGDERSEAFLTRRIVAHAEALPPAAALRFLFRLDADLYPVLGRKAVAYGGGVHPKHRHTGYHDFFVERIDADDRVLDVGCGIGALSHSIAERAGARVLGIDLSERNVAIARERHAHPRVEFQVGDALAGIPGGEFDVIVLSNVLEHLPRRPALLGKLARLPEVQRLLLRVPLFERDWRVPLRRELGVEWRLDPTHETEYTVEGFRAEVRAAGLAIAQLEVRWGEIWSELRV